MFDEKLQKFESFLNNSNGIQINEYQNKAILNQLAVCALIERIT